MNACSRMAILLAVGACAAPVDAASISVAQVTSSSVTATIQPDAAEVGRTVSIWMAAVSGGTTYVRDGADWIPFAGGPFPVAINSVTLSASTPITVISGFDIFQFPGAELYVGYGATETDMRTSPGKLAKIYTVPSGPNLSVTLGPGILGSPIAPSATFASGAQVPYTFSPTSGYSAAIVRVDGRPVPEAGTLTMNANHWLWAFGNPLTGTPFARMMAVPSDFTQIPYPQFYQNPPSFDFTVAEPYCALTSDVVAYPTSFLGAFPLPSVRGAPLPASILRGAGIHDKAWDPTGLNDAATNYGFGCRGDLHTAFVATIARLKRLGADYIVMYRDTQLADTNATQLQILPAGSFSISDTEMAWAAAQAHTIGLKVYEYRQFVWMDAKGALLPEDPTLEWATKFLDTYIPFVVDRARVAQQNGVEAFMLDWSGYQGVTGWHFGSIVSPQLSALFKAKMTTAAQQVRNVFSGKILFGGNLNSWTTYDQDLLRNVDWMFAELGLPFEQLTPTENMNLTVPMMKQRYASDIVRIANAGDRTKPRIFFMKAMSYRDYFTRGFIEDMFCDPPCTQRNEQTDFSVQAIAYEAMLEAIAEQTSLTTVAVHAENSWFVDVILPMDSFPNLAFSWRNKPTESILYQWFKR